MSQSFRPEIIAFFNDFGSYLSQELQADWAKELAPHPSAVVKAAFTHFLTSGGKRPTLAAFMAQVRRAEAAERKSGHYGQYTVGQHVWIRAPRWLHGGLENNNKWLRFRVAHGAFIADNYPEGKQTQAIETDRVMALEKAGQFTIRIDSPPAQEQFRYRVRPDAGSGAFVEALRQKGLMNLLKLIGRIDK